jgi:phosphonate degradation associated HDIG domain protein
MPHVKEVLELFDRSGDSQYGGEAVTQLEHALQSALLAEQEGASASLITAALLHDIGHLLHDLPDDAPDQGIDDGHENSAFNYLRRLFPDAVTEPVRLHVAAKRYLCAVEPGYLEHLSGPSIVSLRLQGGPMSSDEVDDFRRNLHCEAAIRLRRWDDMAKDPHMKTPALAHFAQYVRRAGLKHGHA